MVRQALSGANLIVGDPLLDVYEINTPAACNAVNSPTDDALCSSSSNLASSDTSDSQLRRAKRLLDWLRNVWKRSKTNQATVGATGS